MSTPLSMVEQDCVSMLEQEYVVKFYTPALSEQAFNRAALPVAQRAINPQLDDDVKPGLLKGRVIPLQLRDSGGSTDSPSPTEDDHSEELYYVARNSSGASIIGLRDDDRVVVQESEFSASPDTVISISPKPGIVSKVFSRIFKKSNEQIAQSIVKEIDEKYGQFTTALEPGQSFEGVKNSLNNTAFISRIMELKDLSGSVKSNTNQKVEDGLKLFKQMMKALEFIDVATQRNPSIKLNATQIQVVKSILEGTADPLYQTLELKKLGEGTYGTVDETRPDLPDKNCLASYAIKCCKIYDEQDYPGQTQLIRKENELILSGLQAEYEVLMQFDHPNIIQPIYVHDRVLYMELAQGGPLNKKYRTMEGRQLIETLIQTADALAYMHEKGYVHGDVKVDNIFLTAELDAKVGDLGLCQRQDNFKFDFEGSYQAYYFPPECLSGHIKGMDDALKKQAALKMDSWSFGAMLWLLLNNSGVRSIYNEHNEALSPEELRRTIIGSSQLKKFTDVGCDIARIMCACLDINIETRPTMAEVREMLKAGSIALYTVDLD